GRLRVAASRGRSLQRRPHQAAGVIPTGRPRRRRFRAVHRSATAPAAPTAIAVAPKAAEAAGPTSAASPATVVAQVIAPATLNTANRGQGIPLAPAVTAANTRTPGTK